MIFAWVGRIMRARWRRARMGAAITAGAPEARAFDRLGAGSYLAVAVDAATRTTPTAEYATLWTCVH